MAIVAETGVGSLPSSGAIVLLPCAGYGTVGFRLSGTFTGTVTFEGSVDGATWSTLTVTTFDGSTTATTATSAGQWTASCAALTAVRTRMSSYTSGTCDVALTAVG